jgi:heptosyltransferase-2
MWRQAFRRISTQSTQSSGIDPDSEAHALNPDEQILVVGPSWVGDMVMAQSLFRELQASNPSVAIDVLAPPWSLPLVARMPETRKAIEIDVAHGELGLKKRIALGRRLRRSGYARAIILPRSLKAAVVPFVARIPVRTGYRGEWRYGLINDVREFDPIRLDQTVKRFVNLGREIETSRLLRPALSIDKENLARLRVAHGLSDLRQAVALMPGSEYGPAKRWPVAAYRQLARRLVASHFEVWVLGSAGDAPWGGEIAGSGDDPRIHNLCGKTALVDTIDLLSAASAAVTNDSGLLHVAAAARTHVVAIYGSSSPELTPPLSDSATVLYERLECSPCFERLCPLGHLNCLHSITVDAVEAAVLRAAPESPVRESPRD